eukprot:m.12314 g.12314  ORF g.12314 m.12314 type:complete len:420 (+) comp2935_c0_seq1:55-1314(+)
MMASWRVDGKLKEGLDLWRTAGLSADACESILSVSRAGGERVAEPLLGVVHKVLDSLKRDNGGSASVSPTPHKRPRVEGSGDVGGSTSTTTPVAMSEPAPVASHVPTGVVLPGLSVTGRGKVDVEVVPDVGLSFVHKDERINISKNHVHSILQVPHPHKHKKQVLVIINHRDADSKLMSHLTITLKEADVTPAVDHTDNHAGGLYSPETASTTPMVTWLKPFLINTLGNPPDIDCSVKPIPCHKGTTEGFLYLLEGGVLFLTKTMYVPVSDMASMEMSGGARMTFNLDMILHATTTDRKGNVHNVHLEFMLGREHEHAIQRHLAQLGPLLQPVESDDEDDGAATAAAAGGASADERSVASAGEDDSDDEMQGSEDGEAAAAMLSGNADMSSDEDEFDPEAESSDSCGEEYDENHESDDE